MIEKLCHPKPSGRYKVDQALQHPWITRNFEDKIPRTLFEESIYQTEIDTKLRKVRFISLTVVRSTTHACFSQSSRTIVGSMRSETSSARLPRKRQTELEGRQRRKIGERKKRTAERPKKKSS